MTSDNFSKIFLPEHPHRRLHILVSILAFLIVVGSITVYQISKIEIAEQKIPIIPDPSILSPQQRQQAISELKEVVSKSPPLTDKERAKAIAELKKTIANQKK